jgi:hypothetical protein
LSIHDEDGRTLTMGDGARVKPLLSDFSGSGVGTAFVVVEAPENAAYMRFGPSQLGAGLVRISKMQLEYGAIPSAWTNDHAPSGSIAVTLDTRTPGLIAGSPWAAVFLPRKFASAGVVADDPPLTTVTWLARARERDTDPWSPPTDDVTQIPVQRFVEITVNISTADLDVSPEIDEIYVQGVPPRPILLRADGTEYRGGVLVDNLPARQFGPNTEAQLRQSGRERLLETHKAPHELNGLRLRAVFDSTAVQVGRDSTHDDRLFVIEGYGFRRLVQMINVQLEAKRRQKVPSADVFHYAEDVSVKILEESVLE